MTNPNRSTLALLAALLLPALGCGVDSAGEPDFASVHQDLGGAPASKVLNIQWQGQQTGYWCGPASTRIALTAKMAPPSQATLASYLGTTTNGTNSINLVSGALNHYLGTTAFTPRGISDPPSPAQITALRASLVATISNGYAMVGNIVSGWRPPGYPSGTIYHYIAIVGYDQDGMRALIADPAAGLSSSWANVPTTYYVTLNDLAVWIGGKGYAGTDLPIAAVTPPSSGTLIGAIYQQGNSSNRVGGAVVTVGTQSVTTAADGMYQFTLAPGSYTATVTKAGFGSNTATRTVLAGAQVWGSMEINAQAATGVVKGKVFAYNAANPADMSVPLTGAVVTAGGQSQTTAADGMYSFTLAGGTYAVDVSKSGYSNNSVSRTVTVGGTIWGSVGLTGTATADTQAPQVAISFPTDNAQLELAVFNLAGTASDDRGAISEVSISLNNGAATKAPVTAGKFSLEVKLKPGANTLKVSATDAAGNVGSVTSAATFNAGIAGFVYVDGDETRRLGGAHVELLDKTSGAQLAQSTVDATGAFALSVTTVPLDCLLVVSANGFRTSREEVTAPDDRRLQVKVALVAGGEELGTQSGVSFKGLVDGAVITSPTVTVVGVASGFEVANVKVNGVEATLLQAGNFQAIVSLAEGENTIEAVATGTHGETAKASIQVTRKLGVFVPPEEVNQRANGCSALGFSGFEVFALLAFAPLLRRRRA